MINTNFIRQRFGLFSIPPAGVGGTGDYELKNSIRLDWIIKHDNIEKKVRPDGKVLTEERNIFPGPRRSGKTESTYFSKTGYITISNIAR